ncbi:hypothetical protein CG51_05935 [Haematobacter missouriensis]|mgnify:CR=1 FL=1|uniref:Transcriptional regulator n=1 Tax=Haematobacter missouriensis TaxID=366616 RepID=A0A212AQT6_9RHOB|nr:hypothetical protein [Haematobacter missouriensis]KFI31045.1 hypothetical protein CG51_05935 [Haematobacter missouriensis]OWJ73898.1 hypothetical protein CDV53_14305 [Haematobacter missouriensis]OWJ83805.1 hypothetical protein CDV52_09860 [Haematobacter missouriensis]
MTDDMITIGNAMLDRRLAQARQEGAERMRELAAMTAEFAANTCDEEVRDLIGNLADFIRWIPSQHSKGGE